VDTPSPQHSPRGYKDSQAHRAKPAPPPTTQFLPDSPKSYKYPSPPQSFLSSFFLFNHFTVNRALPDSHSAAFCLSLSRLLVPSASSHTKGLFLLSVGNKHQAPTTSGLAIASIEGNNNLGLMFTNDLDNSLVISQLALNRLAPSFRFYQAGFLTSQVLQEYVTGCQQTQAPSTSGLAIASI